MTHWFQLCTAIPLMTEDVFFFHPFRNDGSTAARDRQSRWSQLIKTYLAEQMNKALSAGGFRPVKDTARIEFPTKASRTLDILGTINQCAVAGAEWQLDDIEKSVKRQQKIWASDEMVKVSAISRLLNFDVHFSRNDVTT